MGSKSKSKAKSRSKKQIKPQKSENAGAATSVENKEQPQAEEPVKLVEQSPAATENGESATENGESATQTAEATSPEPVSAFDSESAQRVCSKEPRRDIRELADELPKSDHEARVDLAHAATDDARNKGSESNKGGFYASLKPEVEKDEVHKEVQPEQAQSYQREAREVSDSKPETEKKENETNLETRQEVWTSDESGLKETQPELEKTQKDNDFYSSLKKSQPEAKAEAKAEARPESKDKDTSRKKSQQEGKSEVETDNAEAEGDFYSSLKESQPEAKSSVEVHLDNEPAEAEPPVKEPAEDDFYSSLKDSQPEAKPEAETHPEEDDFYTSLKKSQPEAKPENFVAAKPQEEPEEEPTEDDFYSSLKDSQPEAKPDAETHPEEDDFYTSLKKSQPEAKPENSEAAKPEEEPEEEPAEDDFYNSLKHAQPEAKPMPEAAEPDAEEPEEDDFYASLKDSQPEAKPEARAEPDYQEEPKEGDFYKSLKDTQPEVESEADAKAETVTESKESEENDFYASLKDSQPQAKHAETKSAEEPEEDDFYSSLNSQPEAKPPAAHAGISPQSSEDEPVTAYRDDDLLAQGADPLREASLEVNEDEFDQKLTPEAEELLPEQTLAEDKDEFYQELQAEPPARQVGALNLDLDSDDDFLDDDDDDDKPATNGTAVAKGTVTKEGLSFLDSDDELLSDDEPAGQPLVEPPFAEPAAPVAPAAPELKPRSSVAEFHTEQRSFDLPLEILPQRRPTHPAPRIVSRTGTPKQFDQAPPANISAPVSPSTVVPPKATAPPPLQPPKAAKAQRVGSKSSSSKYAPQPNNASAAVPPPSQNPLIPQAPQQFVLPAQPPASANAASATTVSPAAPQVPPTKPLERPSQPDPFGFPGLQQAAPRRAARAAPSRGSVPIIPPRTASPAVPPVSATPPAVQARAASVASPPAYARKPPPRVASRPPQAQSSAQSIPTADNPQLPLHPQQPAAAAQQTYPPQTYPQQAYPQQAYPQQAYPQQVYPQQGFPQPPNAPPVQPAQSPSATNPTQQPPASIPLVGPLHSAPPTPGLLDPAMGQYAKSLSSSPVPPDSSYINQQYAPTPGPANQQSHANFNNGAQLPPAATISKLPLPLLNLKGPIKSKTKELEKWIDERIPEVEALPGSLLYKILRKLVSSEGESRAQQIREVLQGYRSNMRLETSSLTTAPDHQETATHVFKKLATGDRIGAVQSAIEHRAYAHALLLAHTMKPEEWHSTVSTFIEDEAKQTSVPLAFIYRALSADTTEKGEQAITELKALTPSGELDTHCVDSYLIHWADIAAALYSTEKHVSAGTNAALKELGKLLVQRDLVEEGHTCLVLAGAPLGSVAEFMLPLVSRVDAGPVFEFDTYVLAETYEYHIGKGSPALLPHKLHFASLLGDAGHCKEALKIAEVVAQVLKSTRNAPLPLVEAANGLVERYSSSANQSASGGGWLQRKLSRPNLEKAWVSSFNKFISGEDEDIVAAQPQPPQPQPAQTGMDSYANSAHATPKRPLSASGPFSNGFDQQRLDFQPLQRQSSTPGPDWITNASPNFSPSTHQISRPATSNHRPAPVAEVDEEYSAQAVQPDLNYGGFGVQQQVPSQQMPSQQMPSQQMQDPNAYQPSPYTPSQAPMNPQVHGQSESLQQHFSQYAPYQATSDPYAQQGLAGQSQEQQPPASQQYQPSPYQPQLSAPQQQSYQVQQPVASQAPTPVQPAHQPGAPPIPPQAAAPVAPQAAQAAPVQPAPEPVSEDKEAESALVNGPNKEDKKDEKKGEEGTKKKGWLSSWFKKDDSNAQEPIKVKLGSSTQMYFDKELGRWVQKGGPKPEPKKGPPPPPKAAAPAPAAPTGAAPPGTAPPGASTAPPGTMPPASGTLSGTAPPAVTPSIASTAPGGAAPGAPAPGSSAPSSAPGTAPPGAAAGVPPVAPSAGIDGILAVSANAKGKRRPARSRYVSTTASGMPQGLS